ncbi:MAG TPA: 50S ribosomal protein L9, partial [Firmicutes bacterium]|nr:50S ribosomal protein L9 [Bacillota bacterium]
MKVLLKQDVKNLGKAGEIKEVKEGFARNYLFPRQLAEEVTAGKEKELKIKKVKLEKKRQKEKEAALIMEEELKNRTIAINARCGDKGKLFGSITTADIATALKEQG